MVFTNIKTFKFIVFLGSLLTFMSCGSEPEKTGNPVQSNAGPAEPQSYVSYRVVTLPNQGQQNSGVQTVLIKSQTQFSGTNPLIVSATVPNEVEVQSVVYEPALKKDSRYVTNGMVKKNGEVTRNIPDTDFTKIEVNDGKIKIDLVLKELKSLLLEQEHSSIEVIISVFNRNAVMRRSIVEIKFELQTPRSKLKSNFFLPPSRYEEQYQINIPQNYKVISLPNGERAELIGVLELKNEDAKAYNVLVPSVFNHEFKLVRISKTASISECSHNVSEAVTKTNLDSAIRILPLGQKMAQVLALPPAMTSYPLVLEKDETIPLGFYSNRQGALTPPAGDLQSQSVPSRCMAHCYDGAEGDWADLGKWGSSCVECGRSSGNMGATCYQCMREHREWCRWQHWNSWKEYTNVLTGLAYQYELNPETQQGFSEFSLFFGFQSNQARTLRVLSTSVTITGQ